MSVALDMARVIGLERRQRSGPAPPGRRRRPRTGALGRAGPGGLRLEQECK